VRFPALFLGRVQESLPVVFDRKRIYTLPTRFGFFFGLVALLCVFGGLNYNNNVVLILAFLVAALGFVSLLYAFLNLRGVRVLSVHADPVFAGEKARFIAQLEAPTARDSVVAEWRQSAEVGGLHAALATPFALEIPSLHRGTIDLPAFRIWTDYPFGLFYAWSHVRVHARTLVYPKPEREPPQWPDAALESGETSSRQQGDDDLFGLTRFQPGDRAQRISWAVYARNDALMVKDFRRTQTQRLRFDLAQTLGLALEPALARLCAWILLADRLGLAYSLKLGAESVPLGTGVAQRERCLASLALYSP